MLKESVIRSIIQSETWLIIRIRFAIIIGSRCLVCRLAPHAQIQWLLLSLSEQLSRLLHFFRIKISLLQVVHDFLIIIRIFILFAIVWRVYFGRRSLNYSLLCLREHTHTWLLALFLKLLMHSLPVSCNHILDSLPGIVVQVLPRIILGWVICRLEEWVSLLRFICLLVLGSESIELGIFLSNSSLKCLALLL